MSTRFKQLKSSSIFVTLLLLFCFFYEATAQTDWVQLFYDNFEDGVADGWELKLIDPNSKWEVINIDGNYVLYGENFNFAKPEGQQYWTNFSFEFKTKLTEDGQIQIGYRKTPQGGYLIRFSQTELNLIREGLPEDIDLANHYESFSIDNWNIIEIIGIEGNIKIYINDDLKIDYLDQNPIFEGSFAFYVGGGSSAYFDDITVIGEPPPLPPDPPSGYAWEKTGGPNGGLGYDIRIHPLDKNIMFVTDNPSGVNKSYNGGETWIQKNDGITVDSVRWGNGAPIFSLTIDPGNPDIIWAGTQDNLGIYKSTDGGETWDEKINGITDTNSVSFRGFAIHPQNSNIVLAASENNEGIIARPGYELARGKIYKTIDGGENWYTVWDGENLARVLIFDYENPNIVYCSTGIFDATANNIDFDTDNPGGEGILKSIDCGETWYHINNGIDNLYIGFLEMHPSNPKILYAAAGGVNGQAPFFVKGGIYKTVDGGENWKKILETGSEFMVVTISKSNPDIIYAGNGSYFFRSDNGGSSWYRCDESMIKNWGPPGIWGGVPISAVVDPDNPDVIFVNSYQGGNYKSIDGAKTWINASKGYSGARISDVSIDPGSPEIVYTVGFSGQFKSLNGGIDWIGMKYGAAHKAGSWHCLTVNPNKPNELLMSDETLGYIMKSENYGLNWEVVFKHPETDPNSNDNKHGFKEIVYSQSNPSIIYAGMHKIYSGGGGDPLPEPSYGIYKSIDGGSTWIEKNNGLEDSKLAINAIAIHPNNPQIVYVGTLLDGIYKTTNGGENWFRHCTGLGFSDVRSLAIDPNDSDIIYAGSGDGKGIYKTTDGGDTWYEINNGFDVQCPSYLGPIGNTPIGFNLEKPKTYSYTNNSFDYLNWTKILDIVIDPVNSQKVYVADLNMGIYLSEDSGASWYPINDGISVRSVTCLTISSDGKILYAGTSGAGIQRMVLGENKAPSIISTIPNNSDTVSISIGDSLWFETTTFDFDGDTLSYKWFFDNQIISGKNKSRYLLKTNNLNPQPYSIRSDISDNDTTMSVTWDINIISPTFVANDNSNLPKSFSLKQNYPNPFNPTTTIEYQLPKASRVELKIFNMVGQEIKNLISKKKQTGFYSIEWDGTNNNNAKIASGIYIYRVEFKNNQNSFIQARKMILLK